MPGQDLNMQSPESAARDAVARVLSNGSRLPLVDAANLLIDACRTVDPSDPGWSAFLATINRNEVDGLERLARSRGTARKRLLRIV